MIAALLIMIPLTLQSGYSANNALVKAELFPAHIRGLGVALPYAIGNAIFAGTVEYVALWLKGHGVESKLVPSEDGVQRWIFAEYLASDGTKLKAIAFRALGTDLGELLLSERNHPIHLAGRLVVDEWGAKRVPSLQIEDAAIIR